MPTFDILAPKLGESVQELTITNFFVKKGDIIEEDDMLFEVASDKVDSEIPSPVAGTVVDVRYKVDDVVPVGEIIAVIALEGSTEEEIANATSAADSAPIVSSEVQKAAEKIAHSVASGSSKIDQRFYSPLVKSIVKKENISSEELRAINGSGKNGRVQKQDIFAFLEQRGDMTTTRPAPNTLATPTPSANISTQRQEVVTPSPSTPISTPSQSGQDMIIEMDRMRKIIADRMSESKRTAPHVTSMVEADVTNIVNWRNKKKDTFFKREGKKLTFMPIIIEAVSKALRDFPAINAHLNGYSIVQKKDINIGIAVATNDGNLMVPVIKSADQRNIVGITAEMDRLAQGARVGKIDLDDLQGGTFTISNFGSFRNVMGTPIINIPEVAILAVGTIEKKPAVIETAEGDLIVPRSKMFLSLSYDHRVVDGMLGGSFLRKVADYLEQFDLNRDI